MKQLLINIDNDLWDMINDRLNRKQACKILLLMP